MIAKITKDLHLHVNHEYFVDIKSGEKEWEYRLMTDYWKKRLIGRRYENVIIYDGYPKLTDVDKILTFPYEGYDDLYSFKHRHFGIDPVDVFAVDLRKIWRE